ncbi:MAG: hypothetical protein KCHDKBKB_01800 [Elusimicrobia bacterium]|nr:hypothetical protein [Elusimicrobiota bacterium]
MKQPIPARIIDQWKEYVKSHSEIDSITLFGSRARGDQDLRSDIDIAVSAPKATQKQWLDAFFFFKDDADTLLPIDVVRLEEASKNLKTKIKKEGRLLYAKPQTKSKY